MELNVGKSKCMKVSKTGDEVKLEIIWANKNLEQVNQYQYLGVTFTYDGKIQEEVNNRIAKANNIYYQINNTVIGKKEVSTETKLQVYNTVFIPTLTYGSESWVIDTKTESRITASEMRYLRKVKGVTKRERIRNKNIREELKVKPLNKYIETRALRWMGHVTRMDSSRLPKRVMEARPYGNRGKGRPRVEWEDHVKKLCEERGKSLTEARRSAMDRKKFRHWTDPTPRGIRER